MRLLDKGKEPARYPARPPLLEHRELTIIQTTMLLTPVPRARRRPVTCCCFGSSRRLRDSDRSTRAPEFVQRFALAQHLASHGSNRPGRECNRQDAVAATCTPVPGSCGAPEVRPLFALDCYLAHRRMALLKGQ